MNHSEMFLEYKMRRKIYREITQKIIDLLIITAFAFLCTFNWDIVFDKIFM